MADAINQKISCLIDDELNYNETLDLLKACQSNPTLQNKLNRYQLISYSLSSKNILVIEDNFLSKVQQGISKDPFYLSHSSPINLQPKRAYKTLAAVAACVSLIALLVSQTMEDKPLEINTISSSTMASITPPLEKTQQKNQQKNNHNTRFNYYLQAHNTSLYTNGTVIFQPLTQTASYEKN